MVMFGYLFTMMILLNPTLYAEYLLTYLLPSEILAHFRIYSDMDPGACTSTGTLLVQVPESLNESQVPIMSFLIVTENKNPEINNSPQPADLESYEISLPKLNDL